MHSIFLRQRALFSPLVVLFFSACGSSSEPEVQALSTPSPTPVSVSSTALAANPVTNGFGFEQYLDHALQLKLASFADQLSGNLYVIKLADDDGNSYYLGQTAVLETLTLRLSLPRHVNSLWLEIFTDQPQGGRVLEEIVL